MTTNELVKVEIQKLDPDTLITLFDLDCSDIGGSIYHFTTHTKLTSPVEFGGVVYVCVPVDTEGFKLTTDSDKPKPILTVTNILLTLAAINENTDDMSGAKLTRRRTFYKFLDGQSEEDSDAQIYDIFFINRKILQNRKVLQYELGTPLDLINRQVPGRRITPSCSFRYRVYDGGFDYSDATCPFTGNSYFDAEGVACAAADDACGKKLFDCRLRHAQNQTIPFGGYPGINKYMPNYRK